MTTHGILTALTQLAWGAVPRSEEPAMARQWVTDRFHGDRPQVPFSFTYGGRPSSEVLDSWDLTSSEGASDRGRTGRTLTYRDPTNGLKVSCELIEYADYPAVDWLISFENSGPLDTPIIEDVQALDTVFTRPAHGAAYQKKVWVEMEGRYETREARRDPGEFAVHHAEGGHRLMNAYEPHRSELRAEQRLTIEGVASEKAFPFFNVEWPGGGLIGAVGWTAAWKAEFVRDDKVGLSVTVGMAKTHFLLHPGERIRMPRILVMFWKDDRIVAHNVWRRLLLDHYCRKPSEGDVNVPMGAAAQWHTDAQNIAMINWHLDSGLPIEYYWMDIGWSRPPTPDEEADHLSDSVVNEKLIPGGIRGISDVAHRRGIKYLLWFGGPQIFARQERVRRLHPDWLSDEHPACDTGNPKVLAWMIEYYGNMIAECGIDVLREDARSSPPPDARPDRIGINAARTVEGMYAFWDALQARFPNLMIDLCGGGGHNVDVETLQRCIYLHRSDYQCGGIHDPDNLFNPAGMQGQTYGISFWVPTSSGCVRDMSRYALRSGFSPGLRVTFERVVDHFFSDTLEPPAEGVFPVEMAREVMSEYRSLRHCFYGDYYPLTRYSLAEDAWMAWQFDRPDLGEGLVQAFRRAESDVLSCQYRLRGLDPQARYRLSGDGLAEPTAMSGHDLMAHGVVVTIAERPAAVLVRYKKVE